MKKLYGIGIGPGDKELITMKGYRLIRECHVVFIPESNGESLAGRIAEDYIKDKKLVRLEFPMGDDNKENYIKASKVVEETLSDDEWGVFLTLGDPMVYSTFLYLMAELEKRHVETESIPGISSFTAAASRAKLPITLRGENFYLCDGDINEDILKTVNTICILKTTKNKEGILDTLERNSFKYVYVKRCTQGDEKILYTRDEILKDRDYISLIIGGREIND
ncbi:cobalt-precorrin-2 C(20)-methyltransferase [Oxobacter pfennigii]|uniref:Cobalt-precorrin-2 C(20)-methyltransferase n=1 Tax=Oxobacter pfennigii TaxID=36849 RepID=A0A0N8NTP5_9CLOT|nr:precorrin-2 C(20)-methyltransferase [Oxobacter pfennigii]KPU45408.1 cobalt-precorrin-2 C(20)-methyltransferase [Oxobacter pfennigii]